MIQEHRPVPLQQPLHPHLLQGWCQPLRTSQEHLVLTSLFQGSHPDLLRQRLLFWLLLLLPELDFKMESGSLSNTQMIQFVMLILLLLVSRIICRKLYLLHTRSRQWQMSTMLCYEIKLGHWFLHNLAEI
jgi:hypothetical protein